MGYSGDDGRCPMKTLDARTRISLKNILFATDFSPYSNAALPYALSLTRRYGAKLFATHVITPEVYTWVPPENWGRLMEMAERVPEGEVRRLKEQLRGIPHELVFREGD